MKQRIPTLNTFINESKASIGGMYSFDDTYKFLSDVAKYMSPAKNSFVAINSFMGFAATRVKPQDAADIFKTEYKKWIGKHPDDIPVFNIWTIESNENRTIHRSIKQFSSQALDMDAVLDYAKSHKDDIWKIGISVNSKHINDFGEYMGNTRRGRLD